MSKAPRSLKTNASILAALVVLFVSILLVLPANFGIDTAAQRGNTVDSDGQRPESLRRQVERESYLFDLYRDPALNAVPATIHARTLAAARLRPTFESIAGKTAAFEYDWKEAGPTDVGGRSRAIRVDVADASTLIAGGASGGIWKSTNAGTTWSLVSENHLTVTAIAQDPRAGQTGTWYASTGERRGSFSDNGSSGASLNGTGLYKSTDNGNSWTRVQTAGNRTEYDTLFDFTGRLVVSPTTGSVFLADHDLGIFRSTDGGSTFAASQGTDQAHAWSDIAVDAQGTLLAALSGDAQDATTGIWRSTDDGASWQAVGSAPAPFDDYFGRVVLAIAPSNPDVAYLYTYMDEKKTTSAGDVDDIRFHKVTLSTGTYEDRSDNMPLFPDGTGAVNNGQLDTQQAYNMTIAVHPNDENHVFIGGTVLYRSRDGFASAIADKEDGWIGGYSTADDNSQYTNSHPDHHDLFFDPHNANRLYNGHDGGLSVAQDVTPNGPIGWGKLNNGFNVTQFFTVSIARAAGDDRFLGGTQDNGSPYFRWDGTTATASKDLSTGDGGWGYLGSAAVYASAQNGALLIEEIGPTGTPDWFNSLDLVPCTNCGALFVNPVTMEPNDEATLFYPAGADLHRSTNGTWTQLNAMTMPAGYGYSALSVSASPRGVLYVGGYSETGAPKVFRLADAETSTAAPQDRSIAAASAGSYVLHIAVNPVDADEIMVSISNFGVESLFHSTDGGQNYTAVEGNLSGIEDGPSVRSAVIATFQGEKAYLAGTSTGLYMTSSLNGPQTVWAQVGSGTMGMAPVSWLDYRPSDGRVAVATHGRGIFVGTPMAGVTNSAPVASDGTGSTNEDAATTINLSASDANGDNLTYTVGTPANGTAAESGGVVTYTPTADFNGTDTFTFTASDGSASSNSATVTVTVAAVNDAPSFTVGANQVTLDTAVSITGWAGSISAGPANESGQTVSFEVTADNAALFSVLPAVSSDGTLTFAPAAGADGTTNVSVLLRDDGGTANGGVNVSASQSFTIQAVQVVTTITGAVVFSVDMSRELALGNLLTTDVVGIRGSVAPLDWNTTQPLSDSDGDGIYTGSFTFTQTASTSVEYKFVFEDPGTGDLFWEGSVGPGGTDNRVFQFSGDQTLDASFWNNVSGVAIESDELPAEFKLQGNYPNPFNPVTSIVFDLPEAGEARVIVRDMLGRTVLATSAESFSAGAARRIQVDASSLPTGTYLYQVQVSGVRGYEMNVGSFVLLK